MTKQEFIILQLKPYFLDPSTCGFENERGCINLTADGRMCVFGKNLVDPSQSFNPSNLDAKQSILKSESRGILDKQQWSLMRRIHDDLAGNDKKSLQYEILRLEEIAGIDMSELKKLTL